MPIFGRSREFRMPSISTVTSPRNLTALRRRIAALESGGMGRAAGVTKLGWPVVDDVLPGGGLVRAAVHEVMGAAASAFAARLAGRMAGPVLWCLDAGCRAVPYGPGLAALGLKPTRLTLVRCPGAKAFLWAMEEGLRAQAPGAVIAAPAADIGLAESRRLQLSAETGGTLGLVVREGRGKGRLAPSALASRWRVEPRAGGGWRVTLERCRGAGFAQYEWDLWEEAVRDPHPPTALTRGGPLPLPQAGEGKERQGPSGSLSRPRERVGVRETSRDPMAGDRMG